MQNSFVIRSSSAEKFARASSLHERRTTTTGNKTRDTEKSVELRDSLLEEADAGRKAPDMWSAPYLGYYGHYICIGVVNGMLQNALQPYCLYVVGGQPNQCGTLATFVNLPWAYKLFYGLLSDSVPIMGMHRKPYMLLGWALTLAGSLAIAILGQLGVALPLELIAVLFLAITVSYIVADCAADAALVTFSVLEPAHSRGSILMTAYMVRFTSSVISASVLAFLFNGPPTQGSFSFGLTTSQLLWIVAGCIVLVLGPTLPQMVEPPRLEEEASQPSTLRGRCYEFYELLQRPAAFRVAVATAMLTTLSGVTNNATNNANKAWFRISPLQLGISGAINNVILAVGMWGFKRFLLNVNWRISYAIGIVGTQAMALLYLLTIYVMPFRNGWWICFTSQDTEVAYALVFAVGVLMIPEIAPAGLEGVTYGAITTFHNAAMNISSLINNLILAVWRSNTETAALATDTEEVRFHMAELCVLATLVACLSLLALPIFPKQKADVARINLQPASALRGKLALLLLLLLMVFGTIFACLPIFPGTSCLVIAGGHGCDGNSTAT